MKTFNTVCLELSETLCPKCGHSSTRKEYHNQTVPDGVASIWWICAECGCLRDDSHTRDYKPDAGG